MKTFVHCFGLNMVLLLVVGFAAAGNLPGVNTAAGSVQGLVLAKDTNEPLIGASIIVEGTRFGTATNEQGNFILANVPVGTYTLTVSMLGYKEEPFAVTIRENETSTLNVILSPRPVDLPTVEIMGSHRAVFMKIPGSAEIIGRETIRATHPLGFNEALRKVAGIHVRDEEGFGIRPNIGVRGLFPTRSGKVLLLEDGIPFTQAPYGDPAAYYHPPINRFDRVEVLKGSGQILFGPQTIGGVINYLTPQPPSQTTGTAKVMGGNRDYLFGYADVGSSWGPVGFFAEYTRKQGQLARENASTAINDLTGKFVWRFDEQSRISLKGNYYKETSNTTYAGLTKIEFEENPYQNQFQDDWFYVDRYGSHLIYDRYLGDQGAAIALNVYGYRFKRHWWRQGNNGGTNSTNPGNTPGVRTILNPTRNDGRNRLYTVWGAEPRFRINHRLFGLLHEADFGVRAHFEIQDRKQIQGNSPTARTGNLVEDNLRKTNAYSAFVQDRMFIGNRWTISAGTRIENVHHQRTNRLNNVSGRSSLTEIIPGVGFTYNPASRMTIYGGIHRGFAPPRVEDAISNTDGSSVDLESEKSWNIELGIRTKPLPEWELHATAFQMDFENQIIPASLAGGSATTLTNAGKTLHRGVELKSVATISLPDPATLAVALDVSYTYLPEAKFVGERFSALTSTVRVTGNRLTYAPEHLLTASVGINAIEQLAIRLESVFVGDQFSDDLNTVEISANGRQGIVHAHTVWNLAANYRIPSLQLTVVLSVKNLFDKVYVVDLSRGMLPGAPRLMQYGLEWNF
jgi:Fe(3+) dicitrate transport protein